MCQDKAHGGARCSGDDSAARRRRRKAQRIRNVHTARTTTQGELVLPSKALKTMDDIKAEVAVLSQLLHAPVDPDQSKQDEIDDKLERRVTQLGLAIGEEIDRRSGVTLEKAREELERIRESVAENFVEERKQKEEQVKVWSGLTKELKLKAKSLVDAYPQDFDGIPENENYTLSEGAIPDYMKNYSFQIPESVRERKEFKEWKTAFQKERASWEEYDSLEGEFKAFDKKREIFVAECKQRIIDANISVLKEIRPLGGDIPVAYTNDEKIHTILKETAGEHYPTSWLEMSAKAGEFVILDAERRGVYSKRITLGSDNPNHKAAQDRLATFRGEDAKNTHKIKNQSDICIDYSSHTAQTSEGEITQLHIHEHQIFDPQKGSTDDEGKPRGKQWRHGYVVEQKEGEEYSTISSEKKWYRIVEEKYSKDFSGVIFSSKDESLAQSTSYHEFAHRMEDVYPNKIITRQEEAFLRRRTTNEQGERAPLIHVSPALKPEKFSDTEFGRNGGFVSIYVGREYLFHDSREVLSMGAETIFSGSNGSFHGFGGYKKDFDHRGFTLGIFATA